MKVLILGATGPTGSLTVAKAQAAGYDVTVLVRDPAKLASTAGLRVLTGDATSATDVAAALEGQDAVISALGAGSSMKSTIASDAADVLVPLAENAGTEKVVVLSAFGVGDTLKEASFGQRLAFNTAMKNVFADKAKADASLKSSKLDWTLIYPVTLNNKPATGKVVVADSRPMKGMPSVSRADVAATLVAALDQPSWSERTLVVA